MATSSSDESSGDLRFENLFAVSDSELQSEPEKTEVSSFFAEVLKGRGFTDWEAVDQASEPLRGATISLGYAPAEEMQCERGAFLGECVQDKSSGDRIYELYTSDGFTGTITQQEIYNHHPDLRPLVLTVTCFLDEGQTAVSGNRLSGERAHTVHINTKKCYHAYVEMMNKFAEALNHNSHGLALLTPNGECLHVFEAFALEFRAQREALRKQRSAAPDVRQLSTSRRCE